MNPGDFIIIKKGLCPEHLFWFRDMNDRWVSCSTNTIFIVLGIVPSAHQSGIGDKNDKLYITDGRRIGVSPRWSMVSSFLPGKDG